MPEDAVGLEPEPSPRRWRLPFTWLGLVALCVVVYELTHVPALGAMAICLKFGWDDFRTGYWLERTDPDRRRGRCCAWLYLGWGLWKTALVAFLMSVGFAAVTPANAPAAGAAQVLAFAGTFFIALLALLLATLATFVAVREAYSGGYRLWLDRAVHRARRANSWPPSPLCEGRTNRLGVLVLTAVAVATVGALTFV